MTLAGPLAMKEPFLWKVLPGNRDKTLRPDLASRGPCWAEVSTTLFSSHVPPKVLLFVAEFPLILL